MIVNENTKTFQTRSDKPNSNWLDENWVVIPDNSHLAKKVETFFPRFDLIFDDDKNVIDVVEIPKTEEELKEERVEEIKTELSNLDNTINRATEDLYTLTETTPYESTQNVINRKIELRNELKTLI